MENLSVFFSSIMDAAWATEMLLTVAAWTILCWRKESWKRLILETLGLFLVTSALSVGIFVLLGMTSFFRLVFLVSKGVIFYLYIRLFSSYERKTQMLLWLVLFNAMQSITALSGQCSMLFGAYIASGAPEGVVRCVLHALIPVTAVYLRRFNFDEFSKVPASCIQLEGVLCGGIITVGIAESCLLDRDTGVIIALMAAYLCLAVTSLVTIRTVYTICREQQDIIDLQTEKQRFLTEREMTHLARKTLEDLRCIRHDLKNQYSYMEILLEGKRYEELGEYFRKLHDNLPKQLNTIDCGNRTMNTVLNMEFSKLRSDHVTVEHQLVVPPVLPFPDDELCSIVSNLLDNAGDECRRLLKNGWSTARLRIEIYPQKSYLFIRCINSTDRTSLERLGAGLRTTKRDQQLHGYGTRIISKLAEKYNGCADYKLEDGMFVAQVMMDMTGRDGKP